MQKGPACNPGLDRAQVDDARISAAQAAQVERVAVDAAMEQAVQAVPAAGHQQTLQWLDGRREWRPVHGRP